jgi:hypothetical protein
MTDLRIPSGATIVADTNSVISYALNRWSVAGVAFHDILNTKNLALSEAIIAEYRTVLLRDRVDRCLRRDLRERIRSEYDAKTTLSLPSRVYRRPPSTNDSSGSSSWRPLGTLVSPETATQWNRELFGASQSSQRVALLKRAAWDADPTEAGLFEGNQASASRVVMHGVLDLAPELIRRRNVFEGCGRKS